MRTTPKDIARSLVDSIIDASDTLSLDDACDSAIALLKRLCPGVTLRAFVILVEKEMKRRGKESAGLLVVPHEHSIAADTIAALLSAKAKKPVAIDRKTDADLIGGAVLLVEHRRIDCSIQGALQALLKTCLQPLE